jgi:hypothetical protein
MPPRKKRLRRKLQKVVAQFRSTPSAETKHAPKDDHVWITFRSGKEKVISIYELSDQHLLNAIRFLETNAQDLLDETIRTGYSVLSTLQGEASVFYSEEEISRLEKMPSDQFLEEETVYDALYEEAKKRRLPVPPIGTWGGFR